MKKRINLEEYVCRKPFEYIQVFEDHLEGCCWDWAKVKSTEGTQSLDEAWKELQWYREKSLKSPLLVCSLDCPFLKKLETTGNTQGIFFSKEKNFDIVEEFSKNESPKDIRMTFDAGCNLHCITCRDIRQLGSSYEFSKNKLKEIENSWGKNLENIQLLGSGDPIYSKAIREFLVDFDSSKFPKIKNVHLHTNVQLLTEDLWKTMKAVPWITSMEISIDAATKKTYEKIRRGGKWEILMKNLEFLTKQETIRWMCVSFVVQRENYTEIKDFYDLFSPLVSRTGRSWEIGYNRVMPWGRVSEEHFNQCNIFTDEEAVKEIKSQLELLDRNHVRTNII